MNKKKVAINVASNWVNLGLTMLAAFIVSPIVVHNLGNERYGIWTLIGSVTSYFTVLDFGFSTAIIRFIAKYEAQGRKDLARKIYSNSFIFFAGVSLVIIVVSAVFGVFLAKVFNIHAVSEKYVYAVFFIVSADLAVSIFFSVFVDTLRAESDFLSINIISIILTIIKNILLVILVVHEYNLLSIATLQLIMTAIRVSAFHHLIKKNHGHFSFQKNDIDKMTFREITSYSSYSFIISVAQKILFYTDSVVIGAFLSVTHVAFYSIPMTLISYLEKIIYAAVSVCTPMVSANEARGDSQNNKAIYVLGTKLSLIISMPILFVLFTKGDSFIRLWMGPEYGRHAANVIKILSVGYGFSLSQGIANSVLKGVSKHKVYALMLSAEAVFNLGLSIILIKDYGIDGVALGTAIPLVVVSFIAIPIYTCKILDLSYWRYIFVSYGPIALFTAIMSFSYRSIPLTIDSYFTFSIYAGVIAVLFFVFSFFFVLERSHRKVLLTKLLPYANN